MIENISKLLKLNNKFKIEEHTIPDNLRSKELEWKLALLVRNVDSVEDIDLQFVKKTKINIGTKQDLYTSYRLDFDIRTAFKDLSSKLKPTQKKQEEWLKLVYDINNNKKSNIQFQVGARFYFNKNSLVNNKDADKVLCKSFLACKPLIDYLFK